MVFLSQIPNYLLNWHSWKIEILHAHSPDISLSAGSNVGLVTVIKCLGLISNDLKNDIFLLFLQLKLFIAQTSAPERLRFYMSVALIVIYPPGVGSIL